MHRSCWVVAHSADEAGQYLTAYKQSEHRQPTLIRERIDKTPSALLRTALTSIPRVNKTDVETLRASFGVRTSSLHPYLYSILRYTELREDRPGRRSGARASPRIWPEKGFEAQRCFRAAVPHRHDERTRGFVHISINISISGTHIRVFRLYGAAAAAASARPHIYRTARATLDMGHRPRPQFAFAFTPAFV